MRKHRWMAALLAALSLLVAGPALARSRPAPSVSAPAAVLYDPAAGTFLFSKAANRHYAVASLTKIMTAVLALQNPLDTRITARPDVLAPPPTRAGLQPGQTFTLGQLLPVMIVHSANDVAVDVADGLAGSVPAFVARMNAEAATLGLRDTHYETPNGLDAPGQYSSARDVAVLSGVAMRDAAFRRMVDLRSASLPGGPTFQTVNPFLAFHGGADGIKTGFTSEAGFCLAASATRDGRLLIAVVLHGRSWAAVDADAAALLDWGFAQAAAPQAPAQTPPPTPAPQAPAPQTPPQAPPATAGFTRPSGGSGTTAATRAGSPAARGTATPAPTPAAAAPPTPAAAASPTPAAPASPAPAATASPVPAAAASPTPAAAASPAPAAAALPAPAAAASPAPAAPAPPTPAAAASPAPAANPA